MDPLSQALAQPRAQGAFSLLMSMRGPWAVHVADEAPLTLLVMTAGSCHVEAESGIYDLHAGDLALVRGPRPYRIAEAPGSPALAIVEVGQRCVAPSGESLELAYAHGLRHWGNDPDGPDRVIVATYTDIGSVGRLVTDVLPEVAVTPAGAVDADLIALVARELTADAPGQSVVIDRLIDVVTIEAIRAWVTANPPATPTWIAGVADPAVGAALNALHAEPDRPWTVAELARRGHVSRATLAARFTAVVGDPPLKYLTRWRLALARDMLADRGLTLDAIAARVGYSSGFALSAAFTREYGESPSALRRAVAAR